MNFCKTSPLKALALLTVFAGSSLTVSARDEVAPAVPSALVELQWMVGSWTHDSEGMFAKMTTDWSESRNVLRRELELRLGSSEPVRVSQEIYWDEVTKTLRSRGTFSDGTTTAGVWRVTDKQAHNTCTITYADGRVGTSVNVWQLDEFNECVFSSTKRTVNGKASFDIAPTEFSPKHGKEQLAVLGR